MALKLLPEACSQCGEMVTTYQERSDHLCDPRIVVKKNVSNIEIFDPKIEIFDQKNFTRHRCYINYVASNYNRVYRQLTSRIGKIIRIGQKI